MRKIIIITDPMQVKPGDKAYFKGCDFGFTVTEVDADYRNTPIAVFNPLSGSTYLAFLSRFDHATREVEEPEWPNPQDLKLHVYLGADGKRYIYNLCAERYSVPWSVEHSSEVLTQRQMAIVFPKALPLTELKLVPVKDDDGE